MNREWIEKQTYSYSVQKPYNSFSADKFKVYAQLYIVEKTGIISILKSHAIVGKRRISHFYICDIYMMFILTQHTYARKWLSRT